MEHSAMNNIRKSLLSVAAVTVNIFAGLPIMAADVSLNQANSTDFSLKLFKQVAKDSSKNVLVSPFSAYEALSMTANGADGSTKAAMAKVLGVSAETFGALNDRNHAVLSELNSNDKVQMEIANAIYADSNTKFRSSFIDLCAQIYQAEARTENFADPQTVTKINAWCDKKTHGKIKEIIARLTPREKMVILNSVYFKGSWENAFKADDTRQQAFTLLSGSTKQVPMMHKTFNPGYLQGQGFEAVCIPYAGKRQVMYVFLPDPGADFAAFQGQFTPENWQRWMAGFGSCKVNLAMPKYKVEFFTLLNGPLTAMGMGEAFGDRANFSRMFETKPGYISRVLQKTYMDVNEEGTEAAAVTAVVMATRAVAMRPRIIDFTVDRPFVVALVDKDTSEILFLGSIVDP
jgi:serine protease inhibitor